MPSLHHKKLSVFELSRLIILQGVPFPLTNCDNNSDNEMFTLDLILTVIIANYAFVKSGQALSRLGDKVPCKKTNVSRHDHESCENFTTHYIREQLHCYSEKGRTFMEANNYEIFNGICDCKLFRPIQMQFECASGAYRVWMSRYNSDTNVHYVSVEYPCTFVTDFPGACYRHLWRYSHKKIAMRDAFHLCLNIGDKTYRHACVHGVGFSFSMAFASTEKQLFPITSMCSIGNTADRLMCIHGYWDGITDSGFMENSTDFVSMKKRACYSLQKWGNDFWEACMLRGIIDLPSDSPLFQTSVFIGLPANTSETRKLVLYGVNVTWVDEFRGHVQYFGEKIPTEIVTRYLSLIGINAILWAVESAGIRQGVCDPILCHLPCHVVGRQLYLRVQNKEMATYMCGNACANGCFHGIFREWIHGLYQQETHSLSIISVLRPHLAKNSTGYLIYGDDMYHALGHAFLENTANYSYVANTQCTYLSTHKLAVRCTVGVWMEYFKRRKKEHLVTQQQLSPCSNIDADFPAACYMQLPLHKMDSALSISAARGMCMALYSDREIGACLFGFGFQYGDLYWAKNRTVPLAEMCSDGSPTVQKMCVYGIFARLNVQLNDSYLNTKCSELSGASLQQTCMGRGRDWLNEPNLSLFYYTSEMRKVEHADRYNNSSAVNVLV